MVETKLRHLIIGILLIGVMISGFRFFGDGLLSNYNQQLGAEKGYFTGATNATTNIEKAAQSMEEGTEGTKALLDQESRLDIFGTLWDTMRIGLNPIKDAWFLFNDAFDVFEVPDWAKPLKYIIPIIFTLIMIGAAWRTQGL